MDPTRNIDYDCISCCIENVMNALLTWVSTRNSEIYILEDLDFSCIRVNFMEIECTSTSPGSTKTNWQNWMPKSVDKEVLFMKPKVICLVDDCDRRDSQRRLQTSKFAGNRSPLHKFSKKPMHWHLISQPEVTKDRYAVLGYVIEVLNFAKLFD